MINEFLLTLSNIFAFIFKKAYHITQVSSKYLCLVYGWFESLGEFEIIFLIII